MCVGVHVCVRERVTGVTESHFKKVPVNIALPGQTSF